MSKDKSHMQHRYIELFLNSTPGNGGGGGGGYGNGGGFNSGKHTQIIMYTNTNSYFISVFKFWQFWACFITNLAI